MRIPRAILLEKKAKHILFPPSMNRFRDKIFRTGKTLPAAVCAAVALLLAASVPPVGAQSTPVSRTNLEIKEETGIIELEGQLIKSGTFIFRENIITYKHENRSGYPNNLKINKKEFKKDKPFELGFMPDFSHAEILEQECGGKTELELDGDVLLLKLDQRKVRDEGNFRIRLSLVDPEQGVQPVDESLLNRKPEKKTMPTKMDLVKIEHKVEELPVVQEPGRRTLPSKMDLVRIEHDVEELPPFTLDPVTGKMRRTSKMDLITMKRKKLPDAFTIFLYTRPVSSYYPGKVLSMFFLKVPRTLWTIEDEEYYQDPFRMKTPWFVEPTDEEVRAKRAWENEMLLKRLRSLKENPE